MSTRLNEAKRGAALAVETMTRKPQQGRSKASLERMLMAARDLMLERGNEDFTLQEVSQRGSVSIGSIYLRFESKDNLVRAVIAQNMIDIGNDEDMMFIALKTSHRSLGAFVPAFVEAYAEVLRLHAPLLRLSMDRASRDPLVSEPGKKRALSAAEAATSAILDFRNEIAGNDPETKAESAFHIIFATLARQLSLGSTGESVHNYDWQLLKRELGRMCLAYLRAA